MTLDVYGAYLLAAAAVLVLPGPTVLLVVSQAVAHGKKAVWPLAAGVLCGDFTAMSLSLLGLGAVLAVSATLFHLLKWAGAAYLVFLGIRLWRSEPASSDDAPQEVGGGSARSLFTGAFLVTATNPKGIAFFVAFLPQFVRPGAPALPQLLLLGGTFLGMATLNAALYGRFAGELREVLGRRSARRWFVRLGAGALVGAGVLTAALRRST